MIDDLPLTQLVKHVKNYLGPDWGTPQGPEHERTFLIAAISHLADFRGSFKAAYLSLLMREQQRDRG